MKRKRQEGAVVIEATISLTTVMFLIVTILSIVNICLAQAKISTLTHGIAKDISNYTYIYTLMGLNQKEAALSAKADYSRKTLDSLGDIASDSTQVFGKISELSKTVMDKEFWESSLALVAKGGLDTVKGDVVDDLCKLAARKRLASMGTDADAYLRHLGIESGVEGLNFERSEVCSGGGDDIKIIVEYEVHLLKLLGVDLNFRFEQCAYTKTWCARSGDDRRDVGGKKEDSEKKDSKKEGSSEPVTRLNRMWEPGCGGQCERVFGVVYGPKKRSVVGNGSERDTVRDNHCGGFTLCRGVPIYEKNKGRAEAGVETGETVFSMYAACSRASGLVLGLEDGRGACV